MSKKSAKPKAAAAAPAVEKPAPPKPSRQSLEEFVEDLNERRASVHDEFAKRSSPLLLAGDQVVQQYRDDFRIGLQVLERKLKHDDQVDEDVEVLEAVCLVVPRQDDEGNWCVWERKALPPVAPT